MTTLNEFQSRATQTAIYPNRGQNIIYPALGLVGEAGEVAEKVKKALRDDGGVVTPERRATLVKELGDVMWYIAALADELGVSLQDVADAVLAKLAKRQSTGTLQGSGDDREEAKYRETTNEPKDVILPCESDELIGTNGSAVTSVRLGPQFWYVTFHDYGDAWVVDQYGRWIQEPHTPLVMRKLKSREEPKGA